MIKAKDYLELILIIAGIIGIVLRIAQVKSDIYTHIDKNKDELNDKIGELKHEFAIHLTEYVTRKEGYSDRFHGLDEAIQHKFNRCWDKIKEHDKQLDEQKISILHNSNDIKVLTRVSEIVQQIQGFLQKHNFNPRNQSE